MQSSGESVKTTKGLKVSGLQKAFSTRIYSYRGHSGRVRVIEGNPYHDDYAKWDDSGKAFNHDYGDLVFKESRK